MCFSLGPLGGALVERLPKKATMIASDIVRFGLMVAMGTIMLCYENSLTWVAILAILSSIVSMMFTPARRALLPLTVDESSRLALNAIDGSIGTLTLAIAPAIAGLLLIWMNPAGVIFLNGLSFLGSALLLARVSESGAKQDSTEPPKSGGSLFSEMKEGILHLKNGPEVFAVTVLSFASHIAAGATWVFVPLISLKMGMDASGSGYLSAAIGLGSVIGMFLGGTMKNGKEMRIAFLAVFTFSLSVGLWSFASEF